MSLTEPSALYSTRMKFKVFLTVDVLVPATGDPYMEREVVMSELKV